MVHACCKANGKHRINSYVKAAKWATPHGAAHFIQFLKTRKNKNMLFNLFSKMSVYSAKGSKVPVPPKKLSQVIVCCTAGLFLWSPSFNPNK